MPPIGNYEGLDSAQLALNEPPLADAIFVLRHYELAVSATPQKAPDSCLWLPSASENNSSTSGASDALPGIDIEFLHGNGGFSGARLWRVVVHGETFALRVWPTEHPDAERLAWMHSVLDHAKQHGFDKAPIPRRTLQGASFVEHRARLWQIDPWMPGTPAPLPPSSATIASAMATLAEFHQATCDFAPRTTGPQQSLVQRKQSLELLLAGGLGRLRAIVTRDRVNWPDAAESSLRVLDRVERFGPRAIAELSAAIIHPLPRQVCLRDIRSDHLLYREGRVVSLVDFGAMRIDCRLGDLARLSQSLAEGDRSIAAKAIEAYERSMPLSFDERACLAAYVSSSALLSGVNWLRWIFEEQRTFDEPAAALERLNKWSVEPIEL